MKRNLVVIPVALVLLGFLGVSLYSFWMTFTVHGQVQLGENLAYVANALIGLVGGIVGFGFGLSPKPTNDKQDTVASRSMGGLGSLVAAGETAKPLSQVASKSQVVFGYIYAVSYFAMGTIAVALWIFDDFSPDLVKNLATVFIGMIVPIVAAYLKENS